MFEFAPTVIQPKSTAFRSGPFLVLGKLVVLASCVFLPILILVADSFGVEAEAP